MAGGNRMQPWLARVLHGRTLRWWGFAALAAVELPFVVLFVGHLVLGFRARRPRPAGRSTGSRARRRTGPSEHARGARAARDACSPAGPDAAAGRPVRRLRLNSRAPRPDLSPPPLLMRRVPVAARPGPQPRVTTPLGRPDASDREWTVVRGGAGRAVASWRRLLGSAHRGPGRGLGREPGRILVARIDLAAFRPIDLTAARLAADGGHRSGRRERRRGDAQRHSGKRRRHGRRRTRSGVLVRGDTGWRGRDGAQQDRTTAPARDHSPPWHAVVMAPASWWRTRSPASRPIWSSARS